MNIETEEILKYKFNNGLLIWPLIRYRVLNSEEKSETEIVLRSKKTVLINLIKGFRHITFRRRKIFFFTSTLFNVNKEGVFFNVLDDYYADCFPENSFIFESPDPNYNWRFPRSNKNVSTIKGYIDLLSNIMAKLFFWCKPSSSIQNMLVYLEQRGIDTFGLEDLIIQSERRAIVYKNIYYQFLKFIKPEILVINCACYGSDNALITQVAKELGIKVAEIQHGITSNIAYSYPAEIRNSIAYREYLPDYILTFGEYWHTLMSNLCIKIPLGHPHMDHILKMNTDDNFIFDTRKEILFISQPSIFENLSKIAINLSMLVDSNEYRIIYRLHPKESNIDEIANKFNSCKVEISDAKIDIYTAFKRSHSVVGVYSMALFEALAFKKKIFVIEVDLSIDNIPRNIGTWVKTADEIRLSLNDPLSKNDFDKYWVTDFESRYRKFIKELDVL